MMKLRIFLIAAVSIMVASTVSAQSINDITTKLNEGMAAANARDFDKSIVLLGEAYDMSKTSTEEGALDIGKQAYAALGSVTLNSGKKAASTKDYDAAIKAFSKGGEIFTSLSDTANAKQAIALLSKVYELKAFSLNKAGDFDNALAACQEGLVNNPNSSLLLLLSANSKYSKGNTSEALADYAALYAFAKSAPQYAKIEGQVNNALLSNAAEVAKTNVDLAEDNIALVLGNNPKNEIAHMQRVQIYNAAKDYKSVIKYGDEAVAAQTKLDNKMTLNYIIGAAYQVLLDNDNAVKYYNKVTSGQYAANAKQIVASLTKKP
ncbi:MAG: hypothetical protein RRZ64_07440 [Rikenellaceae bacterium]